jgi:hypothetical protein
MRHLLAAVAVAAVFLGAAALALAAEPCDFDRSARNSISYVDMLFFTGRKHKILAESRRYLMDRIGEAVRLPRFDYNALPEEYVKDFKVRAGKGNLSFEELAALVDETLAPHLVRVLDRHKLSRAFSEVERERFIVIKAKEDGITAADLESVMNAAYFFFPFVDSLKTKKTGEGEKEQTEIEIHAGVAWYHLGYENGPSRVDFVGADRVSASASAKTKEEEHDGKKVKPGQYAFRQASKNLMGKLALKSAERFPTRAPIEEFEYPWVSFALGESEGIKVDTKFRIAECVENAKGERERKNVGYVMARKIGGKREGGDGLTRAKAIIGHKYEKGMMAIEHPRLGVDVLLGVAWLPLKIPQVAPIVQEADSTLLLQIDEEYSGGMYAAQVALQGNLAPTLKIPQFFLALQGDFGLADVGGRFIDEEEPQKGEDLSLVKYLRLGGGLLKKHYSSRLAWAVGVRAYYGWIFFGTKIGEGDDEIEYDYKLGRWGVGGDLGLEFALSIDFNIGVAASYESLQEDEYLELRKGKKNEKKEEVEAVRDAGIEFEQGGPTVRVYITYST